MWVNHYITIYAVRSRIDTSVAQFLDPQQNNK
jgi:hypothetical protein